MQFTGVKKVVYNFPNGKTMDLYYIGTLAANLGRATDTLRKWEIAGILPDTCFKDQKGCRLYSEEQIDAIVNAAVKSKIAQGKPISQTSFAKRCHEAMDELRKKYREMMGGTNNGEVTENSSKE